METIILGWYILVETQSVSLLALFAALSYAGTLFAPVFGVAAHRIGGKRMLCAMRGLYALLATSLMVMAFTGWLTPMQVFVNATLMGLVRPSDLVMRYALIGETMPASLLMSATSVSRTTQDSARVLGALTGAGLVAALGMGSAYAVVATLYTTSFLLALRVTGAPRPHAASRASTGPVTPPSPWGDLTEALAHVWNTPLLFATITLACLVNLTAFPMMNGLLPHVAKDIYHTGQTGLGYLVASCAFGALIGSIVLSRIGNRIRPARMMIVFCMVWYLMVIAFAQMDGPRSGLLLIALAGLAQSLGMVPMSAMLLRNAGDTMRGRVMGIRMLAVYGVPVGLLIAGPLITRFGYRATATAYCLTGLALTVLIAMRWRSHLWRKDAPANAR